MPMPTRLDGGGRTYSFKSIRQEKDGLLKGLDPYKESGPHMTSPYLCKSLDRPHDMFRNMLGEGLVTREWKTSNFVPIFKKGERENVLSYRTITQTV